MKPTINLRAFAKWSILAVAIITGSGWQIEAQTNIAPIISTNWIAAAPNFREVNGQLYNTSRSTSWKAVGGDIVTVLSNTVVVQKFTKIPVYGANAYGQRIIVAYNKSPDLKYVLQNYRTKNAAVGEAVWVKATRNGTTNYNGEVLELWDCGKPHIVMVVTTNYPHAFKTDGK